MILVRTPFRISLLGGGSDFKAAFEQYPGKVLGFAIDKYSYVAIARRYITTDFKTRIAYYELEKVANLKEIRQPAVKAVLQYLDENAALDISHISELPSQSGLGSSSAFVVGLFHALRLLRGDLINKNDLAEAAIQVERDILGEVGGLQDQFWAAHGGFNTIEFEKDLIKIKPWPQSAVEFLMKNILIIYLGGKRKSATIASTYKFNLANQQNMVKLVDDGRTALLKNNIEEFGKILGESWNQKKKLSTEIANSTVNDIITELNTLGAYGSKLCGGGGTGCIVTVAPISIHEKIRDKFKKYKFIDADVDWEGSKVIYGYDIGNWS